jgi:thiosulfate/3-mercaptopyruvate sulfurtransferase
MPAEGRNARAEFEAEHIPGAVFFDIDEIADDTSGLPHMLARPEKFSSKVRKLGIGDGKRIVVYDTKGLFSAARVWWTFRAMGAREVSVLDGGLPKWKAEGRPLEEGPPRVRERHFSARRQAAMVRDADDVLGIVANGGTAQIVDARSAGRFTGTDPEPRAGLRGGRIPGSHNVPFNTLLNDDGTLKASDELAKRFEEAGVDLSKPVVTSCGSGVTAAVLSLALESLGHKNTALYDGSWSEWGGRDELPVETG